MKNGETVSIGSRGSNVTLSDAESISSGIVAAVVTQADLGASNGVAHIVNSVLLPAFYARVITDLGASYSTMMELMVASTQYDAIRRQAFTLFAPNNTAISALGEDVVVALTLPENSDALAQLIQFHALRPLVSSEVWQDGATYRTLLSETNVTISINSGQVRVENATVIDADLLARDGIAHGIDTVLMPTNFTVDLTVRSVSSASGQRAFTSTLSRALAIGCVFLGVYHYS